MDLDLKIVEYDIQSDFNSQQSNQKFIQLSNEFNSYKINNKIKYLDD